MKSRKTKPATKKTQILEYLETLDEEARTKLNRKRMLTQTGPTCRRAKMKAYIYINPNAPAEVKDLVAEHFLDVSRGELRIHAGGHGRLRG
jgi:hypothetical protein